jgi:hypothetical protein
MSAAKVVEISITSHEWRRHGHAISKAARAREISQGDLILLTDLFIYCATWRRHGADISLIYIYLFIIGGNLLLTRPSGG